MKLLASSITTLLLLVISQAGLAQAPPAHYDAVKDFSIESNPHGVWSYGYLSSLGAPFTLFAYGGSCTPGESVWAESSGCPSGVVVHVDTGKQICGTTWCNLPSYLSSDPGPNCEVTVIRWTAPSAGSFLMQAEFIGEDFVFPTSTYVYVLLNSKRVLLQAPINSYELPLLFNPEALRISKGDTIDLMIGCGADNSYVGDSTGAEMKIWSVGQN